MKTPAHELDLEEARLHAQNFYNVCSLLNIDPEEDNYVKEIDTLQGYMADALEKAVETIKTSKQTSTHSIRVLQKMCIMSGRALAVAEEALKFIRDTSTYDSTNIACDKAFADIEQILKRNTEDKNQQTLPGVEETIKSPVDDGVWIFCGKLGGPHYAKQKFSSVTYPIGKDGTRARRLVKLFNETPGAKLIIKERFQGTNIKHGEVVHDLYMISQKFPNGDLVLRNAFSM